MKDKTKYKVKSNAINKSEAQNHLKSKIYSSQ